METILPKAREAIELARRGDLSNAISSGEIAVEQSPDDAGLRLFIGMLHTRQSDLEGAVPHLRHAANLMPDHPLPKLELARALIGMDRLDEATAVLDETHASGAAALHILHLRALTHQRRGEHAEAAALYRASIARDPEDFEGWANLGLCLFALREPAGAAEALRHSLVLRPDQHPVRIRLVEAEIAAGRGETGLRAAQAEAAANPSDPLCQVVVARFAELLDCRKDMEDALAEALTIDPACEPALLALAEHLERSNRVEDLERLLTRIAATEIAPAKTALHRARLLCRKGNFAAALAVARSTPLSIDPGARAQIIGQASDRLGNHEQAFAAFAEMNRHTANTLADSAAEARAYRQMVARAAEMTTTQWYAGWSPTRASADRDDPTFLFGFPRSGTTLLDTFLMGHPETVVLEEQPALHAIAADFDHAALPCLDEEAISGLRARYFAAVDAIAPEAPAKHLIDKLPLGIVDTALIHRIFPDARFIFVERHPCDVVLSCFMTRFDPRCGLANFLDLQDTARLYDLVMNHWQQCCRVFPLDTHTIRYERMVSDVPGTLKLLTAFLDLEWNPRLLDHRTTARERGVIGTPSYAQVTERIYTRARGRWEKYREQMDGVTPWLAPWADRLGYAI